MILAESILTAAGACFVIFALGWAARVKFVEGRERQQRIKQLNDEVFRRITLERQQDWGALFDEAFREPATSSAWPARPLPPPVAPHVYIKKGI